MINYPYHWSTIPATDQLSRSLISSLQHWLPVPTTDKQSLTINTCPYRWLEVPNTDQQSSWSAVSFFMLFPFFQFELIILPFHGLLATFQVYISLIFYLFWSHCFGRNWSKVVLGSKVMNTFMHGMIPSSFHFLSFSISFPKLTIFTILRLYKACRMWKITALTWEISSWRLVEKFHISAFAMHYSLY